MAIMTDCLSVDRGSIPRKIANYNLSQILIAERSKREVVMTGVLD